MSEDIGIEKRRGLLYQALFETGRVTPDSPVALTVIKNLETDSSINDLETARTAVKVQLNAQLGKLSQPTQAKPKQSGIASRLGHLTQSLRKPKLAVKVDPRAIAGIFLAIVAVAVFSYALRSRSRPTIKTPQAEETPAPTESPLEQVQQVWEDFITPLLLTGYTSEMEWWYDIRGLRASVNEQRLTMKEYFEQIPNAQKFPQMVAFVNSLTGYAEKGDIEGAKASAQTIDGWFEQSAKVLPKDFVTKVIPATVAKPPAEKVVPVPTVSPTKQPNDGTKAQPTNPPAVKPTAVPPTDAPTEMPIEEPTATKVPTEIPTRISVPTQRPTKIPTKVYKPPTPTVPSGATETFFFGKLVGLSWDQAKDILLAQWQQLIPNYPDPTGTILTALAEARFKGGDLNPFYGWMVGEMKKPTATPIPTRTSVPQQQCQSETELSNLIGNKYPEGECQVLSVIAGEGGSKAIVRILYPTIKANEQVVLCVNLNPGTILQPGMRGSSDYRGNMKWRNY